MIRRDELACDAPDGDETIADLVAYRVKAGEMVRIAGLGMLVRYDLGGPGEPRYRLTLTAAVAKKYHPEALACEVASIEDDVRHLARALGAPVETWAPGATQRAPLPYRANDRHITTVRP